MKIQPLTGRELHRIFCESLGHQVKTSMWGKIDARTKKAWATVAIAANRKNHAIVSELETSLKDVDGRIGDLINETG